VVHTDYENSVYLYQTIDAAMVQFRYWEQRSAEVYLGKLMEVEPCQKNEGTTNS
jgi:hypothetical protein